MLTRLQQEYQLVTSVALISAKMHGEDECSYCQYHEILLQ